MANVQAVAVAASCVNQKLFTPTCPNKSGAERSWYVSDSGWHCSARVCFTYSHFAIRRVGRSVSLEMTERSVIRRHLTGTCRQRNRRFVRTAGVHINFIRDPNNPRTAEQSAAPSSALHGVRDLTGQPASAKFEPVGWNDPWQNQLHLQHLDWVDSSYSETLHEDSCRCGHGDNSYFTGVHAVD